ncbi:MAG: site-specific DNA-methyltransferase, partial [Gammaproteobacteria bacterium]|nr:site-specific DNA-methyltransferase [Gammaproteobacteria bacterium]
MSQIPNRTIFTRDNLEVMRGMDSDSVDLIYLDPPFNKKKQFQAPIGSEAAGAAFKDWWVMDDIKEEWVLELRLHYPHIADFIKVAGSMGATSNTPYLLYMAPRLLEMRRVLKPAGSIYLHCDPTMSHYLKILMDRIFGEKNFRNEIVWCYTRMAAKGQRQFSRATDTILWYSKGNGWTFNVDDIRQPYSPSSKAREGYALNKLGSGIAKEGKTVLNPIGKFPENWIADIPYLRGKERTGYPTQKPITLLQRIIKASSNKNDLVLDPFCGCATTCVAAEILNRRWIGIDVAEQSLSLTWKRISTIT